MFCPMNRAQRRQLARSEGHRGSKAKRKGGRVEEARVQRPYVTPDGKRLTQEEFDRTIATAKRMRDVGFTIVDSMLWTPDQG